ncbi:MAG: hypothetical protein ACRC46_00715 [Thermoguttaceae bacterium]
MVFPKTTIPSMHPIFFSIPLVIAFSVCYAATRHERIDLIFRHATRFAITSFVAMAAAAAVLELLAWWMRSA